jgi:hypothetical protein
MMSRLNNSYEQHRKRPNDADEGIIVIFLTKRTRIAVWAEARKLIRLMLIFIFVRNSDEGKLHVRATKITKLRRRSWDFSCSYAGIQAIALMQKAAV